MEVRIGPNTNHRVGWVGPAKTARTARGILRGDIARQDCRFAHKIAVSLSLYVISLPFVTLQHMKRLRDDEELCALHGLQKAERVVCAGKTG